MQYWLDTSDSRSPMQFVSKWIGCAVVCQEATSPALPTIGYDTPFRRALMRLRLKPTYIAMADYVLEQLIDRGVRPGAIHIVPSGVSVPPDPSSGMGSPNVLCVANFSQGAKWKAFDVLFEDWPIVAKQVPQARLYAVGAGDSSEWQAILADKGVSDSVIFTGTVADISKYFSQASIFLLPSRVEGMSNALLEAQMWGLACIVSDIPGNMAVVKHEINGISVPVNDAQALADAVLSLLADEALCRRLGCVARKRAISEYGIESVVDRLSFVYQEVLKEKTAIASSF